MASMYKQWCKKAYEITTQAEYDEFWNWYLPIEKDIYDELLKNKDTVYSGSVKELAQKFNVEPLTMIGFIDGINSSLKSEYNMEYMEEDTNVSFDIDFEKLYFNMLDATAEWLYNLEGWDNILTKERREEITKDYKRSKIIVKPEKIGRNDPCPCGSGKKYKKCCGKDIQE
ncbi:SEC-C domain-containing protein [Peptostreptococcaceae bacterium oral taxon 081]|nr:SEC-C domain-containing protein [Peptostreptococcaceae bacterium oral taxon 081]